ncbi:MAG: nucleoside monophosphate kinase [Patescibacteria group bacterium]
MKPITCVFFGKSGSGKGTQAALLMKTCERLDPKNKFIYVETGQRFRNFVDGSGTYTAGLTRKVMRAGALMPAFIPIWTWAGLLVDEITTGREHMVFDGVSRHEDEAPVLDSALQFYKREKPAILFLDIHHKEAKKRLLKRGRHDDKKEKIAERLRWFEADAMKAVRYFEKHPYYNFVKINGDQTIEKVHEDILKALGLSGRL